MSEVARLFPDPCGARPLRGLFLSHGLHRRPGGGAPFVYTNYLASLDGRIAVESPKTGRLGVPKAIANADDWRLYQELAAQADLVAVSGQFLRPGAGGSLAGRVPMDARFPDLVEWRRAQGLSDHPDLLVISGRLELDFDAISRFERPLYLATGAGADVGRRARAEAAGANIWVCGDGRSVEGERLLERVKQAGFRTLYVVAGPQILRMLMEAGGVDRLYLTQANCLLGGRGYQTLLEGDPLIPPAFFELKELYYQAPEGNGFGQQFGVYDQRTGGVAD